MIEISKYLETKSIGKRALYYQIERNKVFTKKMNGVTYVVDPEVTISQEARMTLKEEAKKEIESLIMKAHSIRKSELAGMEDLEKSKLKKTPHIKQVTEIVETIQNRLKVWLSKGVKLRGYSPQSCYRKIDELKKLTRQKRSDVFAVKNPLLKNEGVYDKLMYLLSRFYKEDKRKQPSIAMITNRVIMYAREEEEFYEIAAIPRSTLYYNISSLIDRFGLKHIHLYRNAHSDYDRKRPWVLGAFTDDIEFMEWYAMDDHVFEVDGAKVYNDIISDDEKKKVYMWDVKECKTLKVIAYMVKTDPFNADDVRTLLLHAFLNMGKPTKGILMDNGLASSRKCEDMLDRLGIFHDPGKAYDPQHKAIEERSFGFIKNEFCAQWSNYIGGGRSEVRHTSKKMSPEECDYRIEDFISAFETYIEGYYELVPRTRKDNGKQVTTNIRDDFEKRYMTFEKNYIKPVDLRKAMMECTVKFFGYQTLAFGNKGLFNPDPSETLDPVLCDRKYLIYYNPLDYSEIDMYAMEDILVQATGHYYVKGDYVATLYNQISKPAQEKREIAAIHRSRMNKKVREISEQIANVAYIESDEPLAFSSALNKKNELLDTRKQLVEKASQTMSDATEKFLLEEVPEFKKRGRRPDPTPEEEVLSNSENDELNNIGKEI